MPRLEAALLLSVKLGQIALLADNRKAREDRSAGDDA